MEKRKAVVSSGATFPNCFAPNAHNKMCLCPRIQEWLKERKVERQRRWGEKEKGGKEKNGRECRAKWKQQPEARKATKSSCQSPS